MKDLIRSSFRTYCKDLFFCLLIIQLAITADTSRDDMNALGININSNDSSSGGGTSPLTARSLRLEKYAQALADSQEELRR